MSDLPGAMTKQILSAPPRIMRSTRYSLTAQGRSVPLSSRLPTGRSSLEKAKGWMRLPRPAAGTMPHMSDLQGRDAGPDVGRTRPFQSRFEGAGAAVRRVLGKRALARGPGDAAKLRIAEIERRDGVFGVPRHQDFMSRREELVEAVPMVGQDRRAAGSRLEQPARGAPAHLGHGPARDVERQARGAEEGRVGGAPGPARGGPRGGGGPPPPV